MILSVVDFGLGAENENRTLGFFPLCINMLRRSSGFQVTDKQLTFCALLHFYASIQRYTIF